MAVVIVPTTGDVSTFDYHLAVKRWQLGDKAMAWSCSLPPMTTKCHIDRVWFGATLKCIARKQMRPALKKVMAPKGLKQSLMKLKNT